MNRFLIFQIFFTFAFSESFFTKTDISLTTALEGKNHGIFCNAIVPTIIDTLQNRAAMQDADFSTWTAPTAIAKEIISVVNSERNGEMIYV